MATTPVTTDVYEIMVEQATGSPRMGTHEWHPVTTRVQAQRVADRVLPGTAVEATHADFGIWLAHIPEWVVLAGTDLEVTDDETLPMYRITITLEY